MNRYLTLAASATLLAALPLSAQAPAEPAKTFPAPGEIVAAAKAEEWVAIAPADLLVMYLAAVADGKVLNPRRVVIQLIPAPFSQGWVGNIRKLAAAHWWDGTSINRVQDNYVVQWGDATEKKALPEGLAVVPESEYETKYKSGMLQTSWSSGRWPAEKAYSIVRTVKTAPGDFQPRYSDPYSSTVSFYGSFPIALAPPQERLTSSPPQLLWPVHCYGMVGVGRNLSPDTGTGAELYTVIGHAPRHLDRNIAMVGRVIEGIEHLSSLPRGTGALGFYEKEAERVPIQSVRLGNEVPGLAAYEYLSTDSPSFGAYVDARANRRDPFFNVPAGGADICNIPVPVRRKVK